VETERRLLRYLTPRGGWFGLALATAFLASVFDGLIVVLLIPLLKYLFGTAGALTAQAPSRLEDLIDWVLHPLIAGATPGQAAARVLSLLVVGLLLKNALGYLTKQIQVAIQEGLVRDLRVALFDHLLHLDLDYFQRTRAGQLISSVIVDVDQVKHVVTAALASFFQNAVVIVVTLLILSQISWRLTLLVLATAPLLVIGMRHLLRQLRRHSRARADERGGITATIAERVGAIKLIRAYGEEAGELERFRSQSQQYRKKVIRTQRFSSLMSPVSEMFGGLLIILIIFVGMQPGIVGGVPLSPEAVVVFLVAALRVMSPIKKIAQFPAAMAVALASAERVFEVLDRPEIDRDRPGKMPAQFAQEIRYDAVAFRYAGGPKVLDQVSFTIPKGRVVAIVGPSGAGKTTLVDLLPRFHDPTDGRILLDGVPLTELTRSSLRALMGVVGQETILLNDTVHANIAFGAPGATRERVVRAAGAANAEEFIDDLPDGYDTMLGERGTRLSGGQRQRIAIARALLRDPPILILDEATSALDPASEHLVQEAIDRLMQDRTVLVIAHRLSTVRHADEIIVLDNGMVVERGDHDALYRGGGLYRRLYDLQFRDEPLTALEPSAPLP
jgi:subfamily B ATP-binding cassette protein MsbA